ncbi:16S rRNA (uracil(1498)-N(3))-methyltransferase [Corynebacterium minutissimum]|uniref:Ribosomal RNA small subunit methyltransferase E n=1 Tax=Corynebacterium minutissimum TaxID=38301 RepID=A0A2X4R783_9CORY|nr:16S rRNA (uracil(1498)-N(3))-methyltransferase [Corynebacterium minutissimum]KHO28809.1 16S rRNA methyltransferase [Corynebacterium minutissimum]MCG7228898.1 16S rRNA (uracil(1498)-N(3))-methyltransferase [Corynebacterium minutissimum]MCG7238015.1 16S rRNA (uracil(1498)-N(3))-methyltransferase [Corynebacterium minutissimum]QPS59441.1 16S rRNA (uracil(1498)-N(3))-methyltransferase [Corynebacterium minutissimum]QQA79769.1 16S rRNA (uracil(1498)-N(3))-methyltransferase [Corynebacterium minutis
MSLPVFLHPDLSLAEVGQPVGLDGAEGRHAVTVKRMGPGESLVLIDGSGLRITATITDVQGKDTLAALVDDITTSPEPSLRVIVVQAIPKSERAELAVDLATQAGADEIIAWQADRCVSKWDAKKAPKALSKWESAAVAAAKQSRRTRIPAVRGPLTTRQLCQEISGARALVLHEDATLRLKDLDDLDTTDTIYLLVGPEGGIGEEELAQLTAAGATAIKLGPEVLRTASASMVALASIGTLTSRW